MKSIRVLHVVAGMDPEMGGVSKAVRMMISGLQEAGVSSETATLENADAPYLKADSFPIHAVGIGKTPWGYNYKLFSWLQKHLKEFDVVIVHGLWLYNSYAVRKIVSQLRKKDKLAPKFFVMPHGMLDPYFQRASGRKIKAIRNWLFWKVIEKKVINEADGILFTCEIEMLLARKTFKQYHPKKELVVGLGVEASPEFSEEMGASFRNKISTINNQPYLLYISRINEKKGIDLLIGAYLKLRKANRKLPALVIAGPGLETEYGQKLQSLASNDSNINFVGMLNGLAKWGAFYGCEAFVLPSHQENFGIAVVEAMACSKPVLISNQINIWKEIVDSGGGLVADDTEVETQKMLETWISLPDEKKIFIGIRAKSCFETHFSIHAATHRLIEVITN